MLDEMVMLSDVEHVAQLIVSTLPVRRALDEAFEQVFLLALHEIRRYLEEVLDVTFFGNLVGTHCASGQLWDSILSVAAKTLFFVAIDTVVLVLNWTSEAVLVSAAVDTSFFVVYGTPETVLLCVAKKFVLLARQQGLVKVAFFFRMQTVVRFPKDDPGVAVFFAVADISLLVPQRVPETTLFFDA